MEEEPIVFILCPLCKQKSYVERYMAGLAFVFPIQKVDPENGIHYGEPEAVGRYLINHFRCASCQQPIAHDEKELKQFLRKHRVR
jgi:hypothetical protein